MKKVTAKSATHTFKTRAWIPEYSSMSPKDLVDGTNLTSLYYSDGNMENVGWTLAGNAEIALMPVDAKTLVENKVASLKQQAIGIRAEATAKCTRIESQIQELLAITYEPTVEVAQ